MEIYSLSYNLLPYNATQWIFIQRFTSHRAIYYLGSRGAKACVLIGDGSGGVGAGGDKAIFLSVEIEKRLDPPKLYPPKLSMDFIYSDALFSMIKASSSSRTMSAMHGR